MSFRQKIQLQIIERLGAPVMASAVSMAGGESGPADLAARTAELMHRAVQLSVQLAQTLDLKDSADGESDAMRVVLASVAGGMVADLYRQSGQVPGDADQRRLLPALDAVLTFADQFSPSPETTLRMDALLPGGAPFDENQAVIQYVQALAPAVQEIAAFSFGLPERKLAQDVAERIVARAKALSSEIFGGVTESDMTARARELGLMKALTDIYAGCHRAEKNRLLATADVTAADMSSASLNHLWDAFETQAAMLGIFAGTFFPAAGAPSSAAITPVARPAAQPAPVVIPATAPVSPPTPPISDTTENKSANPMAFFRPGAKKPPEDSDNGGSFAE